MFKKIAVVLRGHVRVWQHIKDHFLRTYSSLSEEVDYYFVTWDIPGIDEEKIKNSFQGYNLIKFIKVNTDRYYNGANGPYWLSSHALPFLLERKDQYDAVIDTRPDTYWRINKDRTIKLDNNLIYVQWINEFTDHNGITEIGTGDVFFIMTVDTYQIFCQKYQHPMRNNNHADPKLFFESRGIEIKIFDLIGCYIIRPNHLDFLDTLEKYNSESVELYETLWHKWYNLSNQEKINLLNNFEISLEDYHLKLNN